MLEHPSIRAVLIHVAPSTYGGEVGSDNLLGAGNQQETEDQEASIDPWWIVGFTDGEGCFSVAVHQNPHIRRTGRWQLTPVFQLYQHENERSVLEKAASFFGCGRIRRKGPRSSVLTYSVSSLRELDERIIPFFEEYALLVKAEDFRRFTLIVRAMRKKVHLEPAGFDHLVRIAYEMNKHGKQRSRPIEAVLQGSSETVRQAPV